MDQTRPTLAPCKASQVAGEIQNRPNQGGRGGRGASVSVGVAVENEDWTRAAHGLLYREGGSDESQRNG
ncbi:hypothetical protein LIA77_10132 [Sarocladium implicatum]|nr:hypothetical protein LIA77_10132 [Sarocladium implicatum]